MWLKKRETLIGLIARLVFLICGILADNFLPVGFTDLDYKVFTDGAAYVSKGLSPYNRHTYRYSPVLAYLMLPNLYVPIFGKLLFIFSDLVVGAMMQDLMRMENDSRMWLVYTWLLNPLVLAISTRGSCDTTATFLIILTVWLVKKQREWLAAAVFGFSVHFRIYPIIFALSLYLLVSKGRFLDGKAVLFGLVSAGSFLCFTGVFYSIYGWEFLEHSLLYHAVRLDHRHNFSIFFMVIYTHFPKVPSVIGLMMGLVPLGLIALVSYIFRRKTFTSFLLISLIFVSFNKVVTAQYFLWFCQFITLSLSEMPSSIFNKQRIAFIAVLLLLWTFFELYWSTFAHRFENNGEDVFMSFHWVNALFFGLNMTGLTWICWMSEKAEEVQQKKLKPN